ncbi:hypothetical protein FOPE_04132 [Fonsecaea pedrosoi]|nr:hypothetical protein FOPE_04132 [Fonsecaea pedrosoi]
MNNQGQAAGQKEDYLDKGLDAVEKKFGQGKIDPAKQRGVNEKITDKARDMFEKATGKDVPDKLPVQFPNLTDLGALYIAHIVPRPTSSI